MSATAPTCELSLIFARSPSLPPSLPPSSSLPLFLPLPLSLSRLLSLCTGDGVPADIREDQKETERNERARKKQSQHSCDISATVTLMMRCAMQRGIASFLQDLRDNRCNWLVAVPADSPQLSPTASCPWGNDWSSPECLYVIYCPCWLTSHQHPVPCLHLARQRAISLCDSLCSLSMSSHGVQLLFALSTAHIFTIYQ